MATLPKQTEHDWHTLQADLIATLKRWSEREDRAPPIDAVLLATLEIAGDIISDMDNQQARDAYIAAASKFLDRIRVGHSVIDEFIDNLPN
jgi:hypothetical protein